MRRRLRGGDRQVCQCRPLRGDGEPGSRDKFDDEVSVEDEDNDEELSASGTRATGLRRVIILIMVSSVSGHGSGCSGDGSENLAGSGFDGGCTDCVQQRRCGFGRLQMLIAGRRWRRHSSLGQGPARRAGRVVRGSEAMGG